ncbi:MAG: glutathione S-transferase family protein [Pseudomonadota bacterium]
MSDPTADPRYELVYWPIPFRGCFVSYLFAYRNEPLAEADVYEEISAHQHLAPNEQAIPFIGPPVLHDRKMGRSISQMPAIVHYVAPDLGLQPEDPKDQAYAMKVLMDCNDVLMEICRYNGSIMWERDAWVEFRSRRLPRWMQLFEDLLRRGCFGTPSVTYADIAVYALFGNMIRCLPELESDLRRHAPEVFVHCSLIGVKPSLADFVASQEEVYGKTYCGGQIEESIRRMLALDSAAALSR